MNQVNYPNNIYFDFLYTNSLYVADSGNNRIIKFPSNSTNKTLGIIVAGTGSSGNASNRFNYPRAVIIDRNGILYISDGCKKIFFRKKRQMTNDVCFLII